MTIDSAITTISSTVEKAGHYEAEDDFQWDTFNVFDQARIACVSADASCSSWTVLCFLVCAYLSVAFITNLIACYKFIAAWNLIKHELRFDLNEFVQRRRRLTLKEALRTHVTMEELQEQSTCPICLSSFEENQLVTACDDGCHKWFHRECLFNWLDMSNDCPCCRIDMLTKKSPGVLHDVVRFLGLGEDA